MPPATLPRQRSLHAPPPLITQSPDPMRNHRFAVLIALLALAPHRAQAQIGLMEGLFRNLDNVGGFWTYAGFLPHSNTMTGGSPGKPAKQSGLQGPGLAFTFHMGAAGRDR